MPQVSTGSGFADIPDYQEDNPKPKSEQPKTQPESGGSGASTHKDAPHGPTPITKEQIRQYNDKIASANLYRDAMNEIVRQESISKAQEIAEDYQRKMTDPTYAQMLKEMAVKLKERKLESDIENQPEAIQRAIRDYESNKVVLADGREISGDDWQRIGNLDKKYQEIARAKGYHAMVEDMLSDGIQVNGELRKPSGPPAPKPERQITIGPSTGPYLGEEQAKLKEIYDEYEKKSLKDRFFYNGPRVIKDNDGKYHPLVGGEAVTLASPGGISNIAKIIMAVAGGIAGAQIIKEIQNSKTKPTEENVVVISPAGEVANIRQIRIAVLQPTVKDDYLPTPMTPDTGLFSPTPLLADKGLMTSFPYTQDKGFYSETPAIPQGSVSIIDPLPKTADAESYLLQAKSVSEARSDFVRKAKLVTPEIDWNKELAKGVSKHKISDQRDRYESIQRLTRYIPAQKRVTDEYAGMDAAYRVYLRKKKLLAAARKSYIASVDPQPVNGTLDKRAIYALADWQLANYIKGKHGVSMQAKLTLLNQMSEDLSNAFKNSSASKLSTSIQLSTRTQTQTQTQTETQTRTSEQNRSAENTQTNEATRSNESTKSSERTHTKEADRIMRATKKGKLQFGEPEPMVGEKKEDVPIKPGSIAFEQGRLNAGEVVKYGEPPKYKVKTMVGRYPKGYIDRGNTPTETIQTIGGPVEKDVDIPMGVTTAHIEANGQEITFTRNVDLVKQYRELQKQKTRAKLSAGRTIGAGPSARNIKLQPSRDWGKPKIIKNVGITRRRRIGRIQR